MKDRILVAMESPKELENLYQESPKEFQQAFPEILAEYPDSMVLQVWNERINYPLRKTQAPANSWSYKNVLLVVTLSLIAGTLAKLPQYFPTIENDWFYTRIFLSTFILILMTYFFVTVPHTKRVIFVVLGIGLFSLLYLCLLPDEQVSYGSYRAFYDTLILVDLHVPLFLWFVLGIVFAGANWKNVSGRMDYLRYNGELLVYSTIIAFGGFVLTGITFTLIELFDNSYKITNWYTENIVPYGAAAIPIVATFLVGQVIGRRINIAPILAKIFTPLFLLTTIAYLTLMAIFRQDLYGDRDSLIVFNILLFIILGLSIYSIAERDPNTPVGISDYMNVGLLLTTLVIDLIALSAVVFRSNDVYGLTPNRIAILGINILIFCHLAGNLFYYFRFVFKKDVFMKLEKWITGYLVAYVIWSLTVAIVLPLIFWYR